MVETPSQSRLEQSCPGYANCPRPECIRIVGCALESVPVKPEPWAEHPVRTLHACVETLGNALKGYLPWPEEKRDANVRRLEALVEDQVKRADACMTIIEHAGLARSSLSESGERKLDKPALVGNTRFDVGVSERMVVERAQREHEYQVTPEKEAARMERVRSFVQTVGNIANADTEVEHAPLSNDKTSDALIVNQNDVGFLITAANGKELFLPNERVLSLAAAITPSHVEPVSKPAAYFFGNGQPMLPEGLTEEQKKVATPLYFARSSTSRGTAKQQFDEHMGADDATPLERLRFFCSLAMDDQDWLDVEPFFDALTPASTRAIGANGHELHEAAQWMLALIDGGEQMPKPGDEVAEELRAAVEAEDQRVSRMGTHWVGCGMEGGLKHYECLQREYRELLARSANERASNPCVCTRRDECMRANACLDWLERNSTESRTREGR